MSSVNPDSPSSATMSIGGIASSQLMAILNQDDICPGADPSYQICKTLYSYHPLGAKMVDAPIGLAQSMPRTITIPDSPEDDLLEAYWREWKTLGRVGADRLIGNAMRVSRIYGIGSIVVGEIDGDPAKPIDMWKLAKKDLYFNILDPLNTAGSLVLDQDPNAPDFLKPKALRVGSQTYHPS